jgi:Protein of unknown function (DUF3134)
MFFVMELSKSFSQSSFFQFKENFFMLNSPLREEPRGRRAAVIRTNDEFILLEWLKSTGRLIEREPQESRHVTEVEDILEMIAVDDVTYDMDDDDDDDDSDSTTM